jgi:hypothetical protein
MIPPWILDAATYTEGKCHCERRNCQGEKEASGESVPHAYRLQSSLSRDDMLAWQKSPSIAGLRGETKENEGDRET